MTGRMWKSRNLRWPTEALAPAWSNERCEWIRSNAASEQVGEQTMGFECFFDPHEREALFLGLQQSSSTPSGMDRIIVLVSVDSIRVAGIFHNDRVF